MNEVMVFTNEEFGEIRTAIINGKIYFAGIDVARALGYSNTRDAILRHCKGVVKHDTVVRKANQNGTKIEQTVEMAYITEGDIYRLIMKSQLPSAEKFEEWVCDEILPTLRETGTYTVPRKQDSYMIENPIDRAKRWIEEQEEKNRLAEKVEELSPKAEMFTKFLDSQFLVNFRDAAKEIGISQSQFTGWLKDNGYVYANSAGELRPMEQYMQSGLFEVKPYMNPYNGYTGSKTFLTQRGLTAFKFLLDTSGHNRDTMEKHGGRKSKH